MSTTLLEKNNRERELQDTSSMVAKYTEYNPAVLSLMDLEKIGISLPWLILPLDGEGWLPQRLTNPLYGRDILDTQLTDMASAAPGIKEVWRITEKWPSLTQILLDERDNE